MTNRVFFKNEDGLKAFTNTKVGRINSQQTCTKRNNKGNYLSVRRMILNENLDFWKRMKNIRNINISVNRITIFSSLKFFKITIH